MPAAPTNIRFLTPKERPSRTINLAWDANAAGDNVTNYNLYHGNMTGTYTGVGGAAVPIDLGNVTTYAFTTSAFHGVFLALKAENVGGESASYSNEVYT